MSATATSIADVLTARPTPAEPGTAPGTTPALDFSVIVALLQRALATSPAPATVVPGGTLPAGDPAAAATMPGDAQGPATPPLVAPSAPTPLVPLVAASQPAMPDPMAMPADVDPRPPAETPRRTRELAIPIDGMTEAARRADDGAARASNDEPANDERAIVLDPDPVATAPSPAIPIFAPMPVAPASIPVTTSAPAPESGAATVSPVEAFGGSASPFSAVAAAPSTPARRSIALPSQQGTAAAPREAAQPIATTTSSFADAAEAAASRRANAASEMPAPDPAAPVATAPATAATPEAPAAATAFAAAPSAIAEPTVGPRAAASQDPSEPAPDAMATGEQPSRTGAVVETQTSTTRVPRTAKADANARIATKVAEAAVPGADAPVARPAPPRPVSAPVAPLASEAEAPAPTSRDAAVRPAAVPGATPSRLVVPVREGANVSQADAMPFPSRTLGEGAAAYDAGLISTRDIVPGVRRVRAESARAAAVREVEPSRVADRVQDAGVPEAGAMPIDAFAATTRAMAADEPARPDDARMPVVDQIVTRVKELKGNGHHEISMRLDPPELGGVTIDARLDGARLTVHIRAEHGATQEMLADALPRLRESLTQQGFVTDQVNVQLSFDATGGGAFRDGTARDDGRPFAAPAPVAPPPAPPRPARAPVPTFVRGAQAGLDLWA